MRRPEPLGALPPMRAGAPEGLGCCPEAGLALNCPVGGKPDGRAGTTGPRAAGLTGGRAGLEDAGFTAGWPWVGVLPAPMGRCWPVDCPTAGCCPLFLPNG